jgi:hypothetical protein
MVKYSGAEWMESFWMDRRIVPSDSAKKVADILGQAFTGIYHLSISDLMKKVDWTGQEISVPMYGTFSTFDFYGLTALALCSMAGAMELSIRGTGQDRCRLTFSPSDRPETLDVHNMQGIPSGLLDIFRTLPKGDLIEGQTGSKASLQFHCKTLKATDLRWLVQACHGSVVRAEISGIGSGWLRVYLSQRQREGDMTQRHPDMPTAIATLKPMWEELLG